MFVGAPLVARELESGTFRFAWTQGRSRVQWIVIKLVLLAVVLTAFALAFSALFTWWYRPFDAISGRMSPTAAMRFRAGLRRPHPVRPRLGALLGLADPTDRAGMAATAAAWVASCGLSMTYLRPLIRKPITWRRTRAKGQSPQQGRALQRLVVNQWIQDPAGHHLSFDQLFDRQSPATAAPRPETSSTPI